MRRATGTTLTRAECLRRAEELAWLADQAPLEAARADLWAKARKWRSLALVAATNELSAEERRAPVPQPASSRRPRD